MIFVDFINLDRTLHLRYSHDAKSKL